MSTHSVNEMRRDTARTIAVGLGIALTIAALCGLVPGLTDDSGRTFGLFKLNAYQNLLHTVSALWAFSAVYISRPATIFFLRMSRRTEAMYSSTSLTMVPMALRCSMTRRNEQPGLMTSADRPYISI